MHLVVQIYKISKIPSCCWIKLYFCASWQFFAPISICWSRIDIPRFVPICHLRAPRILISLRSQFSEMVTSTLHTGEQCAAISGSPHLSLYRTSTRIESDYRRAFWGTAATGCDCSGSSSATQFREAAGEVAILVRSGKFGLVFVVPFLFIQTILSNYWIRFSRITRHHRSSWLSS